MTRNENDLRDALRELDRRAVQHGAPPTADLLGRAGEAHPAHRRGSEAHRFPRWLAPLAAAGVVAAAAITVVTLSSGNGGSAHQPGAQAGGPPASTPSAARHSVSPPVRSAARSSVSSRARSSVATTNSPAASVLERAAAKLDAAPAFATPAAKDFFYVHTNQATTWTSVSGRQPGKAYNAGGEKGFVPGCRNGHFVSGQSGSCTLNDVSRFLGDAPTAPAAWDAYLEHMAPGAKAAGAQGKIIVQVLHQDLVSPKAAAALLRYTETCAGLHMVKTSPVSGQKLIGVTCTSMTNGSYGLAFDAASHAFVGFVPLDGSGKQDSTTEVIDKTGIVAAIGQTP